MTQDWAVKTKSTWFAAGHEPDEPYPEGEDMLPYFTKVIGYDALAVVGASGEDVLQHFGIVKPLKKRLDAEHPLHHIVGIPKTDGVDDEDGLPEEENLDALQAPDAKKRKRHGEDDEEDEFFTSKKQKKKAKIKNYVTIAPNAFNADDEAKVSRPEKRLPRRSAGQPGIYTDLGKEAVPIKEDDLIPVYSVAPYNRKRKIGINVTIVM
ncbi:hypothetical protein IFR05_016899 [Cadophora sp. M221]|nr:hypothetical protein IFR05_016899 [Cadophora sp. M221]